MTIPFIRDFPNGKRGLAEISRAARIEAKARMFMDVGGRYHVGIAPDLKVYLTAIIEIAKTEQIVATEMCENNEGLLDGVDRIVLASQKYLDLADRPALVVPAQYAERMN